MPLPTRKVVGQAVYGDNTGASGRLRFSPEFLVAYDGVVVLPGAVTVIAGNGGSFEVELATTDAAGYAPADWVWSVEELWPGGRTFLFELPTEDGSDLDYTSLIPAESVADPYAAHTHPELGGLPIGGDAGDIVVKQSSLTGDAEWEAPGDAGIIVEGDARLTDERTPTVHGNEAHTLDFVDAAGAEAAAPVQSVNTLTGDVVLDANDVGAYPDDNPDNFVDAAGAAAAAPVQSVNTQTGDVVLAAADVGAYPDDNPSGYIDAAGAPVQSVNTLTGDVTLAASDVGALPDDAQLDDLADVSVGGASTGDVLAYDGDDWVPDSTAVRSDDVGSIVVLTETEYDALDPADPTVLYVVVDDPEEDEE
jgi:hypothetical protein